MKHSTSLFINFIKCQKRQQQQQHQQRFLITFSSLSSTTRNNNTVSSLLSLLLRTFSTTSATTSSSSSNSNNKNENEVTKFSNMSTEWWDPTKNPLIHMNVIRIDYMKQMIQQHKKQQQLKQQQLKKQQQQSSQQTTTTSETRLLHDEVNDQLVPFTNYTVLDIGCGGGLVCESIARLGAKHVTGIDLSKQLIQTAQDRIPLKRVLDPNTTTSQTTTTTFETPYPITYVGGMSVEELLAKQQQKEQQQQEQQQELYDIICCYEVIEHIGNTDSIQSLINSAIQLLKPNGLLFISTINRTIKSHGITIVGGEYILQYLPVGTHTWTQYLSPNEVYTNFISQQQQNSSISNNNNTIYTMEQLNVSGIVLKDPIITQTMSSSSLLSILSSIVLPKTNKNNTMSGATASTSSSQSQSSPSSLLLGAFEWQLSSTDTDVNWIACYTKKIA